MGCFTCLVSSFIKVKVQQLEMSCALYGALSLYVIPTILALYEKNTLLKQRVDRPLVSESYSGSLQVNSYVNLCQDIVKLNASATTRLASCVLENQFGDLIC